VPSSALLVFNQTFEQAEPSSLSNLPNVAPVFLETTALEYEIPITPSSSLHKASVTLPLPEIYDANQDSYTISFLGDQSITELLSIEGTSIIVETDGFTSS